MLQLALTLLATQVLILLILRPLILWYLKINRMTRALESIDKSLKCLPAVRERRAVNAVVTRRSA